MKSFSDYRSRVWACFVGMFVGLVILFVLGHPAFAQTTNITRQSNSRNFGVVELTGLTQTFATTTPTLVTGAALSNSLANDPSQTTYQGSASFVPEFVHVWWSVDISKATSGGATCGVYLNNTLIARSVRTMTGAAWPLRTTLTGFTRLSRTDPFITGGMPNQQQVIDVRCNSSDTATATVAAVSLVATEMY